jgi:hypothetical protein
MVGTLWVVDALFAFANAGAKALHLHWGLGGDPSGELGQPNVGVMTNFYYDVGFSDHSRNVRQAAQVDACHTSLPCWHVRNIINEAKPCKAWLQWLP